MKKKVAFFVNGLYGGGAEKVLQTLLRFLDCSKFEVTLYSVLQENIGPEYPANIDYRYMYGSAEGKSFFPRIMTLCRNKIALWIYDHCSPSLFYRFFVKGKYDVEVAFIEGYATRIVSGSPNSESKKIAWVHTDIGSNHWTKMCYKSEIEERSCYQQYDKVIGVSKSVKEVDDKLFSPLKFSSYIYNPIDFNSISSLSEKPVLTLAKDNKLTTFITCGRLVHQKGFDRLIEVTSRLVEFGNHLRVIIIGEGEERSNLEALIKEYKLESVVFLLGYQSNPFKYYQLADWFICTSRAEGFSLVVLEAMAAGLPVIATNCSGPNEIIGDSEFGLLAENTDDGIFNGMQSVIGQDSLNAKYRELSTVRIRDFELSSIINQIEAVLC